MADFSGQAPPSPLVGSASRHIAGGGTSEATWQAWPYLATARRLPLNTLVPVGHRLVVVAPHPDDEVLACGGLLASHVARGGACLVAAVTDGEASHAGSTTVTPQALAMKRRAESVQGLEKLGVRRTEVVRFGLPDGEVRTHAARLTAGLQLILRPTDVVVCTWRYDGHPDHEATAQAVATVCAAKDCALLEAPVWMWHWAEPNSPQVPWEQLSGFALAEEVLALKQQALAVHVSQLTDRDGADPAPVLGDQIQQRAMRRTEFFFISHWSGR